MALDRRCKKLGRCFWEPCFRPQLFKEETRRRRKEEEDRRQKADSPLSRIASHHPETLCVRRGRRKKERAMIDPKFQSVSGPRDSGKRNNTTTVIIISHHHEIQKVIQEACLIWPLQSQFTLNCISSYTKHSLSCKNGPSRGPLQKAELYLCPFFVCCIIVKDSRESLIESSLSEGIRVVPRLDCKSKSAED